MKSVINVDEEISLIKYFDNYDETIKWYDDLETCKLVDNIDHVYDKDRLMAMYTYLNENGQCYYISYKGILVGDITLCGTSEIAIVVNKEYWDKHIGSRALKAIVDYAKELKMDSVFANIYSFNTRSQKLFLNIGFKKVSDEKYVLEF